MKTKLAALLFTLPFLAQALPTTNYAPRTAVVSWTPAVGTMPTNFTVYVSTNSFWAGTNMVLNPTLFCASNTPNQTIDIPGLTVGKTFYFVVTAQQGGLESDYSQQASLTVPPKTVAPPTLNVNVTLAGSSTPVGPWDTIDLLAEYLITPDCDYAFYRAVVDIHR